MRMPFGRTRKRVSAQATSAAFVRLAVVHHKDVYLDSSRVWIPWMAFLHCDIEWGVPAAARLSRELDRACAHRYK